MVGRIRHVRIAAAALAALGVATVGGASHAAGEQNINVKSMTNTLYAAPQKTAMPKDAQGAGAMDPDVAAITLNGKDAIFYTFTQSRPLPNNPNRDEMQGAFGVSALTPEGTLQSVVPVTEHTRFPRVNQGRNFMKPMLAGVGATATGDTKYVLTVMSTEYNGNQQNKQDITGLQNLQSNGNPQVVGIVQEAATGKYVKVYNLTTVLLNSIGEDNDQQQWGTPEIAIVSGPDGKQGTGEVLVAMSQQRNNQTCWMGVFGVQPDGTVQGKSLLKVENQCQHGRPSAAIVPGSDPAKPAIFMTHVRADNQPAEIGVAAEVVQYNGGTGKGALTVTARKLVAASEVTSNDMRKNKYMTQPTGVALDMGGKPIFAVGYTIAQPSKAQKSNGHAGASNENAIVTLDANLNELDRKIGGVNFGASRHARLTPAMYDGKPALAMFSGQSFNAGFAGSSVNLIDPVTGKIADLTADRVFAIANNVDVAGLCTMGKNNPNDQALCFINQSRTTIANGTSKTPEVKRFNIAIATATQSAKDTRLSLTMSLIPAAWDPAVKVTPAGAVEMASVPSGPTPREAPVVLEIPKDPSNASNAPGSATEDEESKAGSRIGDSRNSAEASSCSAAPAPTAGFGGFALVGLGLAIAALRRNKKEH